MPDMERTWLTVWSLGGEKIVRGRERKGGEMVPIMATLRRREEV